MALGEKIVMLRTERHLTQEALAELLGVSRQSVSKWETGGSVPDLEKLVALSGVFGVSLDQLVRDQAPPAPSGAQPAGPSAAAAQYPTRKIVGWILLGVGLLSLVLGLALQPLLIVFGGYLLLCGALCLAVKRHLGLVIGWGTFVPCMYLLPLFTAVRMRAIFQPHAYQGGLTIQLLLAYAFWAILLLLVFFTVRRTRLRRHPFLFCGWVIFSQLFDFLPIAFRYTQEVGRYYLALSWCAILLLLALLFFTGKCLCGFFSAQWPAP